MTPENIQNYLSASLPGGLDTRQLVALLARLFMLVSVSALVIDLLLRPRIGTAVSLGHAAFIGTLYVLCAGVAATGLSWMRHLGRSLRVWHIWSSSLVVFLGGFFLIPLDSELSRLALGALAQHADPMTFAQLLPVWFLVTYLFVNTYLTRALRQELSALRELNAQLAGRSGETTANTQRDVKFEAGRTSFTVSADAVRNINVDDHYCYVHFYEDGAYVKQDLPIALSDLIEVIPPDFIRVHRSHVVNPARIASVRRRGRNIRILLDGGYEVPVSRHRLDEVLPLLQQHAGSAMRRG